MSMINKYRVHMWILIFISSASTRVFEEENEIEICSESSKIFWKYMWPFLEDRHTITISAILDNSQEYSREIIECGLHQAVVPIEFYVKNYVHAVSEANHSVFTVNVKGFIFIADSAGSLEDGIHQIYSNFANSKMILVLPDRHKTRLEYLLKLSWEKYKVLNLIAIRIIENKKNSIKGQYNGSYLQEASVLNPFIFINESRGYIFNMLLTDSNNFHKRKILIDFVHKRQNNIHSYPLKVCIASLNGSALPVLDENGNIVKYSLKDGEIMDILANMVNFTPSYFEPQESIFGSALENGTVTGSLTEIESSSADILGNLRPIQNYGQTISYFLFPPDETAFAFLTPKMGFTSTISFLEIFHYGTYLSLLVTYVIMILVWHCLQQIYAHYFRPSTNVIASYDELFLILFRAIMLTPQKFKILRFERLMLTTIIVFSMIISYSYQGKMMEVLMGSKISLDIQTIEQLAQSNLKILTTISYEDILKDIAENDVGNSAYSKLYKRQIVGTDILSKIKRVSEVRDAALLSSWYTCRRQKATVYDNITGEDLLHVTKEGPPLRFTAHLVHRTFPLRDRFNQILINIRESGLILKWKAKEMSKVELRKLKRYRMLTSAAEKQIYSMDELWFIFAAFGVCCAFSAIVFCVELLTYKLRK